MQGRTEQRKTSRPLITSSVALRGLATLVTVSSFTGVSAFAATHPRNASAPLRPTTSVSIATPTPSPTTATRRTTIGAGIPTTSAPPRTRSRSS